MLSDSDINRVLVVQAHPDDVDFGAAATVAGWTDAGIEVTYLIVTDGDAGGFDPEVAREDIPGIRRAEQTAAAKCAGVEDVRFLGYQDGRVATSFELRRDISRVIRQVRPERVILPSPERNYGFIYPSHPDHRAVGAAALDAVYPDARNPFAHPELARDEGLDAWTVGEVWIVGGPAPGAQEHAVDVTDTAERKMAALRAHASQTGHMDDLDGLVHGMLSGIAREHGLQEGRLAEAFKVINTK